MTVGLSTTAAGQLLTTLKGNYTWAKLHVGDPGAAGTSNAAVETDRIQATWPTTVSNTNTMSNENVMTWTAVGGSEDYTHISFWTASTAGTFGMSGTITANPVTSGDTFELAVGDVDVTLPVAT
jgi:hypothetical protein